MYKITPNYDDIFVKFNYYDYQSIQYPLNFIKKKINNSTLQNFGVKRK